MTILQTSIPHKSLIPANLPPGNGGYPWQRPGETSGALPICPAKQRIPNVPAHMNWYDSRPARQPLQERGSFMFLILAVVLVLLWLGGFFVLHVSSFLIHLLLIFALISIIMNFVGGRRAV
jgi:hypothetical protein